MDRNAALLEYCCKTITEVTVDGVLRSGSGAVFAAVIAGEVG